jgi:hypothetical protein
MYPQIILLGDRYAKRSRVNANVCSLIQRCYDPETPSFGPALQHAYFRRADVLNRGFGGYNTEWLLPVLENQILPFVSNVVLWVILIGANDAMLSPGPNHVLKQDGASDSGSNQPLPTKSAQNHKRYLSAS